MKHINQLFVFIMELAMLASFGFSGFHMAKTIIVKYLLGIAFPIAVAIVWGIFEAPRSSHRLPQPYRFLLAIALFMSAAFLLYKTGYSKTAITFAIAAIVTQIAALVLEKDVVA
jgi:hypothetical protein